MLVFLITVNIVLGEEITLNVGESKDINGNSVKLKSLKSDKAVITVNNESKILEIENEEDFLGIKVKLLEIFYFGPNEGNVKLNVVSVYSCGDGKCESSETKLNCCRDCGCQSGYDCEENKCLVHVEHMCNKDEECDDNNPKTSDRCAGYPRKCQNIDIAICHEDEECDDNNECTKEFCRNEDCFYEKISGCERPKKLDAYERQLQEIVDSFSDTENKNESGDEQTESKQNTPSFWQRIINFFRNLFN